jgi:hypothetical protein
MLAQLAGAGIGGLVNAWNAYEQGKKQKEMLRLEEDYNRSANAKLERANEANQLINPQAAAQRQRQDVAATQAAAVGQALNAAAGQSASSGDFGNAQASGIQMSQAAQAAASPFAQQQAQISQQAQQAEQQKVQQSESIANSQAKLSDYVTYLEREKNNINPLASALQVGFGSLVGGANVATNLLGLGNDTDKTTQSLNIDGRQVQAPVRDPIAEMQAATKAETPNMGGLDFTPEGPSQYDNMFQPEAEAAGPYDPNAQQRAMNARKPSTFNPYNMAMTLQQGLKPVTPFFNRRNNY